MKKSLVLVVIVLCTVNLYAQTTEEQGKNDTTTIQVKTTEPVKNDSTTQSLNNIGLEFQPDVQPTICDYKALKKLVVFPQEAVRGGIEGKVIVAVFIDSSGTVTKAQIIESPDQILNGPAIKAIVNYEGGFTPGEIKGKPVGCWLQIPITFKIR